MIDLEEPKPDYSRSERLERKIERLRKEDEALRGRDWNYYQQLKKKDINAYLSPKVQVQLMKDAVALGDDFGMPDEE